ncbi:hypothetical protein AX761_21700 [Rhizobium sp. 58]|nr:hypothetical protein AX761_21700 [Rhizobium sp. 58]
MATKKTEIEGIDFDQNIYGPNGKVLDEVTKNDGKEVRAPVTLGAMCYVALMAPQSDRTLSMDEMLKLAQVASIVTKGGVQMLTVQQKNLILDRIVTTFIPAFVFGIASVIDPELIEAL